MRLIRINEVIVITGLSRTTIYRLVSKRRFPLQVNLLANCVAWIEDEVIEWVKGSSINKAQEVQ